MAQKPGRIVTFYSYKGGTGRTMALANVAWILASNGYDVLLIDWDLEAPGLHRYLHPFLIDPELASTPGLLDFVWDAAQVSMTPAEHTSRSMPQEFPSLEDYVVGLNWNFHECSSISFIPAGRQDENYAQRVNTFNWDNFYERLGGGKLLHAERERLRALYDYILIDSRTGVSDTSSICTVQMPDILVGLFTLNNQSIEGVAAIFDSVLALRDPSHGGELRVFPVASRVEDGEQQKLEAARTRAREVFSRFVREPSARGLREYWDDMEVPYKKFYAYEEILATFGDPAGASGSRDSLLSAMERLTRRITGLKDVAMPALTEEKRQEVLAIFAYPQPVAQGVFEEDPRLQEVSERVLEPHPLDLAPDLLEWVKHIDRLPVRLLIAASAPARYADVNNERALVLDTIHRTFLASGQRPNFDVEVYEWIAPQSMRRVSSTTPSVDEALPCLSFDRFDAVILIVWHNLGPQSDAFSLGTLERTTRETARQHPQHRPRRLLYRRQDPIYTYINDPLRATKDQLADQVQTFFRDLDEYGVPYTAYTSEQFADRFLADYQLLLAYVIEAELRRPNRPVPPAAGTLPPPLTNPYRGLASYRLEDAALFYGRAKEIDALRAMLTDDTHSFIAIAGASGSGKSSLVRAGLVHRLRLNAIPGSVDWLVLDIKLSQVDPINGDVLAPLTTTALALLQNPSVQEHYPVARTLVDAMTHEASLAKVIDLALSGRPPEARLILLIDQFEELFTLIADDAQRRAFTCFLRAVIQPRRVNVIITLRADFYPNLLATDLAELVQQNLLSLAPADARALHTIITQPAERNGFLFEDSALPAEIFRDAGDTAGALPLLSYAMQQFAASALTDRVLTRRAYKALGGVEGVIQRQADEALRDLPLAVSSPATLTNLFRRLVNVDENGTLTEKPTVFDPHDPTWTPEALQLQQALVQARLLCTNTHNTQSIIEIAHEALLHRWTVLTTWIAHTRGALLLMHRVESAAREWQAARRKTADAEAQRNIDRDRLWQQERLAEADAALRSLGQSPSELSPDVQAFLRPEFERLVAELAMPIKHERRAEIGLRLAQLGDRRAGVGLRHGLPDIVWCPVPDGQVTLSDEATTVLGTVEVQPFYIAQYPVTLQQFTVFTQGRIYFNKAWWTGLAINPEDHPPLPQTPEIPNHPAQYVSWYQAMAFCNWLSQQLTYSVRLPTEWEWVQAVTGGHADYLYPWGPTWDPDKANHRQALYRLMSVGMYPQGQSPVGAFDMSGNMYQWCLNEYDDPTNVEPSSTQPHTTRGGAFFTMPGSDAVQEQLSIRHRLRDNPNGMRNDGRRLAVGLRLVCDHPPSEAAITSMTVPRSATESHAFF